METFKWNIRNVEMSPLLNGEFIQSPSFNLNKCSLCLRLYPRGFEPGEVSKLMFLILHRCDEGLESISVQYRLSMQSNDNYKCETYDCNFRSSRQTRFLQKLDKDESLYMPRNEIVEVLHVTCYIRNCRVERVDYMACNELDISYMKRRRVNPDLYNLSSEFTNFLDDGDASSDLRLRVGSKNFNVHKAILHARSQALAEKLQTHVSTHTYSPDTIHKLILYLYSGRIDYSNVPDELYVLLGKLDPNLAKQMTTLHRSVVCSETSIQVRTVSFPLSIRHFEVSNSTKNAICMTDGPMWCWLKLIFAVDGSHKCTLLIHRLYHDVNIFVRCKITIGTGTELCEYGYLFQNEENCNIPIDLKTNYIRLQKDKFFPSGDLNLLVRLDVSNGEHSTNITDTYFTEYSINDKPFIRLSEDFLKLFESHEHSDVTVKVSETEFKVHKAILSARSPVFNSMFRHDCTENKNSEVIIEDMDADVVYTMLRYMYCGKLPDFDTDSAMNLYRVADKYQICMLLRRCSLFLQSPFSLSVEKAGLVLHLADTHRDLELKGRVCDFVCRNAKQVMMSKEWRKVMKSQPGLASEVLEEVLQFVADHFSEDDETQ